MRAVRESEIRRLRGLKNISWLTSRQLNRLVDALTLSRIEKRDIIFDEKHSPESAYLLLSGVARITCRNRKGDRTLVIMVAPGMILARPSLDDDAAYRLAKALHRGEAALGKRLAQARETTAANTAAAAPRQELIHPGVLRYLREIGVVR